MAHHDLNKRRALAETAHLDLTEWLVQSGEACGIGGYSDVYKFEYKRAYQDYKRGAVAVKSLRIHGSGQERSVEADRVIRVCSSFLTMRIMTLS